MDTDRPAHDLLFGRDPGEEVPTHAHAAALRASFDTSCQRLAQLLERADAVLVGSGAGWSSDSKLATYKDIAKVPALERAGLSYYDLCQTHWLLDDPSVFYGFWGSCLESYRNAVPHEGHAILKKWCEGKKARRSQYQGRFEEAGLWNFFIFSSNVDSHWRRDGLFEDASLFEFHGTVEDWCCSGTAGGHKLIPCCKKIWPVPADFRFEVDSNMRAESKDPQGGEAAREDLKEGFKEQCPFQVAKKKDPNRPRCPACSSLLRPRVLHFGDGKFFEREGELERFKRWKDCVWECMELCEASVGELNPSKHVLGKEDAFCLALLEFGCGLNVPTIRGEFARLVDLFPENCILARINPDFPLVLDTAERQKIEIMSSSLTVLQEVDSILCKTLK